METASGPAVKPFFWKKTAFRGTRLIPPAPRPAAIEMNAADATETVATAATEADVSAADATDIKDAVKPLTKSGAFFVHSPLPLGSGFLFCFRRLLMKNTLTVNGKEHPCRT